MDQPTKMFWTQLVSANIAIQLFVHAYRTLRPWLLEGGQPPAGWKEQVERDGCLSESEMEIRRVLPEGHSAVQCWVMDERSVWRDRWPPKIWICSKYSQKIPLACGVLHFNAHQQEWQNWICKLRISVFLFGRCVQRGTFVLMAGIFIFILLRMAAPEHTALTFSLLFAVIYLMTRYNC